MYSKEDIDTLATQLGKKQAENLRLATLSRLIDKLIDQHIEDDEIDRMIVGFTESIRAFHSGDKTKKKTCKAQHHKITEQVRKAYGLVEKGYYIGLYLSFGISIGAGLGAALMAAVNTAFLAVGVGIGLSIGVAAGSMKEEKVKKDGLLY